MGHRKAGRWLLAVLAAGSLVVTTAWANTEITHHLEGKVVRVVDGDTVRLQGKGREYYTVRLASIDAPEVRRSQRPGQPYGQIALLELESLVGGKVLTAECYEVDSYDRSICDVKLPDGKSVNRTMVKQGLAWANTEKRGIFLRDEKIKELQAEARRAKRGIWAQKEPVQPWKWRWQCWRQNEC